MLKESRDLEWIEMALSASFVGVLGGAAPMLKSLYKPSMLAESSTATVSSLSTKPEARLPARHSSSALKFLIDAD